jgi:hypothetical protein
MGRKKWVFLVRFPPGFWILVIYISAYIYQVAANWPLPIPGPKASSPFLAVTQTNTGDF